MNEPMKEKHCIYILKLFDMIWKKYYQNFENEAYVVKNNPDPQTIILKSDEIKWFECLDEIF
jgi:hypothetical protein